MTQGGCSTDVLVKLGSY